MDFRLLGNTDEKIPEIGLGTWQYAGGSAPLQRGIDLDAFLIDTAERYETEDAVGDAIANRRSEVFVATKVRHENLKYDDVLSACDNSLRKLRIDRIDLYQVHRPNPMVPIEETMAALDRLVEDGKVRFIGVSNFSVPQFETAQAATRNRIVSNQVRYSLVDRTIEADMLPYCQQNNVTVIAYSPLARGTTNLHNGLRDAALTTVARREGRSKIQVALNWCIGKPNVVAIPRASTIAHVDDVCAASGWRLSPESVAMLEAAYMRGSKMALAARTFRPGLQPAPASG